jgi:hypothetical protein
MPATAAARRSLPPPHRPHLPTMHADTGPRTACFGNPGDAAGGRPWQAVSGWPGSAVDVEIDRLPGRAASRPVEEPIPLVIARIPAGAVPGQRRGRAVLELESAAAGDQAAGAAVVEEQRVGSGRHTVGGQALPANLAGRCRAGGGTSRVPPRPCAGPGRAGTWWTVARPGGPVGRRRARRTSAAASAAGSAETQSAWSARRPAAGRLGAGRSRDRGTGPPDAAGSSRRPRLPEGPRCPKGRNAARLDHPR